MLRTMNLFALSTVCASAVSLVAMCGAASADTLTYADGPSSGLLAMPSGNYEGFEGLAPGSLAKINDGWASFTGTAVIADPATSVPYNGNTAEPFPDQTQYLSIQAND